MADEPIIPAQEEDAGEVSRAASVRLRDAERVTSPKDLLDPAQQSLADALRVTLRFVQFGMIALGVLFLFSGLTTVKEGETGLSLLFGAVDKDDLAPGFHFAWPYPIGDFLKIDTGTRRIAENEEYWPFLTDRQRGQKIEDLSGGSDLDPSRDGALITADGNLVHTQWGIIYRRVPEQTRKFVENINPDSEEVIVRAAARQGIVRAVAQVTIDQLLKETGSGPGSVASHAKGIAQKILDDLDSGIVIEDLVLSEKMPPLFAKERFNAVQSAEANAQGAIDKAKQEASRTLNGSAGVIHTELRALILEYEEAVAVHAAATRDADPDAIADAQIAMAGVLAQIDGLFESDRAGGDVARMMFQAQAYRREEPNRRLSDARRFQAKLAQFEANPDVTIQSEWADAWATLVGRDFTEILTHPLSAWPVQLVVNRDPRISKRLEESLKARQIENAEQRRRLKQESSEFKTQTEIIESEG